MDNDAVRNYLTLLMNAVSGSVNGAEIIDAEDGPMLVCAAASPFSDGEEIGYQFSITPLDEGLFVIEAALFLFSDIDREKLGDVEKLIAVLNSGFDIGAFRTFDETGSVLFTQGMFFDEELGGAMITDTLGKTVSLMEGTVQNKGRYIYRYLNGEKLETLIGEAREAEL